MAPQARIDRTQRIAGIDRPVSDLALGTAWFTLEREAACFELLDHFVALGGNLIDSARAYRESEAVLGRWLAARGNRDHVVLLTKGGHGDDCLPDEDFERVVRAELSASLDQLQADRVDLYLLHRDNSSVAVERIVDHLQAERAAGRVRAIGVSNWTYRRVADANAYAARQGMPPLAAVSNNLSLALPTAPFYRNLVWVDADGQRWHRETGTPLIAWSSQARGFFTGRYSPHGSADTAAPDDEFTRRMLEVYGTPDNFERLSRARRLGAARGGFSTVETALAWVRCAPLPVVPVIGPRCRAELDSCARALALDLDAHARAWLNLEADDPPA